MSETPEGWVDITFSEIVEEVKCTFNTYPDYTAHKIAEALDRYIIKPINENHVRDITNILAASIDFETLNIRDLEDILGSTIVHDNLTKSITFLVGLLNYTANDQMNLGFNAPSSTGKSHVALEVMKYFPSEDVQERGYVSPKAFYHENGTEVREDGLPLVPQSEYITKGLDVWIQENPKPTGRTLTEWRDKYTLEKKRLKAEWSRIPKKLLVNLHQELLVFLDQPHDKLLRELRPLMSHDKKEITLKITDKSTTGKNATKTVTIIGYPTILFLSTRFSSDEQERTRLLMLSVDMSQDKIRDSLMLSNKRLADRDTFALGLEQNKARTLLKQRVVAIKNADIKEIIIINSDHIIDRFLEEHPTLVPRLQRDFPRLIGIIKACALLNLQDRTIEDKRLFKN